MPNLQNNARIALFLVCARMFGLSDVFAGDLQVSLKEDGLAGWYTLEAHLFH